jgi:hypothetical protein
MPCDLVQQEKELTARALQSNNNIVAIQPAVVAPAMVYSQGPVPPTTEYSKGPVSPTTEYSHGVVSPAAQSPLPQLGYPPQAAIPPYSPQAVPGQKQ